MICMFMTNGRQWLSVVRAWVAPWITSAVFGAGILISIGATVHAQGSPSSGRVIETQPDTVELSLLTVQQLVLRQNPTYLAARQGIEAARGTLRQARIFRFNPDLGITAPGAGANASPYDLTLTQEIEWAGQRGLRAGAAGYGVARTSAEARDVGRRTLADASIAYYRAIATVHRLRVAEEQFALTDRLLIAVRTQMREGEVSALESSLAEIEGARSRARVLAARRDATSATLELTRLIGLAAGTPTRLIDDTTALPALAVESLDALTTAAIAQRPDIRAAREAVRESEALVTLAKREALPNLRLGAVAERDRDGGSSRLGAALGIGIPLFNRNQGVRDQRRAEARVAVLNARAVDLRVRAEVADALRAYETASEEADVFATAVLAPARENGMRLETAYRAGKINLATLLLLRNQLLDAELGYWDAWFIRREALIRLDAVTGALRTDSAATSDASFNRSLRTSR